MEDLSDFYKSDWFIYFIDKFLVIHILIKLCSLKEPSMNQPVLLAMVVFSIHKLSLENLDQ